MLGKRDWFCLVQKSMKKIFFFFFCWLSTSKFLSTFLKDGKNILNESLDLLFVERICVHVVVYCGRID